MRVKVCTVIDQYLAKLEIKRGQRNHAIRSHRSELCTEYQFHAMLIACYSLGEGMLDARGLQTRQLESARSQKTKY